MYKDSRVEEKLMHNSQHTVIFEFSRPQLKSRQDLVFCKEENWQDKLDISKIKCKWIRREFFTAKHWLSWLPLTQNWEGKFSKGKDREIGNFAVCSELYIGKRFFHPATFKIRHPTNWWTAHLIFFPNGKIRDETLRFNLII